MKRLIFITVMCAFVALAAMPARAGMYTMHTATSTVGNQAFSSVGLKFNVNSEISVFELGIYDSGSDGIISVPGAGTTLSTVIFDSTQTLLAQMDFTMADPGTFDPTSNYLFKPLATPLVMAPGEYTIVGYGFNALNKEHNAAMVVLVLDPFSTTAVA